MIASHCLSDMGRERALHMKFSSDFIEISRLLAETREFLTILETGLPFPSQDYLDLSPALNRIMTPGSWILPEELADLRLSLNTISDCLGFFRLPSSQPFVNLKNRAVNIEVSPEILRELNRILDDKGNIRDNASENLGKIRKDINARARSIEKIINQLMSNARKSGWTDDKAEVTISGGRLVIPLLAPHKRKIKGVILDESASGHTVYIEPEACLEINNEIRELESAEKREIIRILIHFSDLLRPERDKLLKAYDFLGDMDFIRAKSILARDIGGSKPVLNDFPIIRWKSARHPLLFLSHTSKGRPVVPLDIELNPDNRILVITGPNAGGKSVCLKTTGLLQYMLQCGILVPMDPDSDTGIFRKIFIDIGDEQSLENDLSTYSSHLLNLKFNIENSDSNSLFLIDELGTGTDPSLGGALAEAVLEKLSETEAFGVVTTHYSNLKLLAGKVPGIVNGAMIFDAEALQPLYKLVIGKPGSSFTYEIAQRTGFPSDVISIAKKKTGNTHLDFEKQLHEVELEKLLLEQQLKEFQLADSFLADLISKYEKIKAEVENSRTSILEKARQEAREMLEQSNRLIEKTIREIKESQADKAKTKAARDIFSQFRKSIDTPDLKPGKGLSLEKPEPELKKWKKGDRVSLEGRAGDGMIVQIKGENATVDFDGLKIITAVKRLQPARNTDKKVPRAYTSIMNELNEKAVNFKLTLDLRGKTADEALQLAQKYLDDAYLLRIREVSILHGKGEGILRKVIREFLAGQDEVEAFSDEHIERGGAGVTKVLLK